MCACLISQLLYGVPWRLLCSMQEVLGLAGALELDSECMFNPLTREQPLAQLRTFLQGAGFDQQLYASHSFRIGAATTTAAAGLPTWLIKAMRQWRGEAYQNDHCKIQGPLLWLSCPANSFIALTGQVNVM